MFFESIVRVQPSTPQVRHGDAASKSLAAQPLVPREFVCEFSRCQTHCEHCLIGYKIADLLNELRRKPFEGS